MTKYGNKKINIDGFVFDSRKEARRYIVLKHLEAEGKIKDLQMQVKYILIPTQREADTIGKRGGVTKGKIVERECAYIADFRYIKDGREIVEDTKGYRTKDYIIKRKLMLYIHGIKIIEI